MFVAVITTLYFGPQDILTMHNWIVNRDFQFSRTS